MSIEEQTKLKMGLKELASLYVTIAYKYNHFINKSDIESLNSFGDIVMPDADVPISGYKKGSTIIKANYTYDLKVNLNSIIVSVFDDKVIIKKLGKNLATITYKDSSCYGILYDLSISEMYDNGYIFNKRKQYVEDYDNYLDSSTTIDNNLKRISNVNEIKGAELEEKMMTFEDNELFNALNEEFIKGVNEYKKYDKEEKWLTLILGK